MEQVTNIFVNSVKNWFNYGENVRLLEKNLEKLTCRADDFEEEVKKAKSSGKKKRKREVENWLENVKKVKDDFNTLQNKVKMEGRLKNLMCGGHVVKMLERVAALVEQSESDHFNELVLDAREIRGPPQLTCRLFGEMFEVNLEKIKKHLMPHSNIKSIGICGMGGMGKTTLAKHINNHLREISDLCVCWLTVSQKLSIRSLQDGIAKYMNLSFVDDDDEEHRVHILSQKLKEMKFVLILDDVWSPVCLEKLGISLEAEHRLILTTRSLKWCHQMQCQEIIQVKTLQDDEAWELFKATFGYQTRLEADTETVAKKIVKRCGGLPLGIITMAGSMRGVENVAEWRDALTKLQGHNDMEEKVFSVLQWSFNRLNKWQKCCLWCCSLYPEDFLISREEIISRFISLDLMDRRDTRRQEYDQGHAILDDLKKSCLLEEATENRGDEAVKVHDLIRDMTLKFTSGNSKYSDMHIPRYMVKSGVGLRWVPSEREWVKDLQGVSLMDNDISEISTNISPQCSNLSVLILSGNYRLKSIPDSFFDHFKTRLKVIDLSHTSIKELPNCISDMVNLNALILRNCWELKFLPPLGKLGELRELDLNGTSIEKIPEGLEALVSLKYLHMNTEAFQVKIPEGTFSKLHSLQFLKIIGAIEIKELQGMKQLKIFEGYLSFLDGNNKLVKFHHIPLWLDCYRIHVNKREYYPRIRRKDKELIFKECDFGNNGREVDVVLLPQDIEELAIRGCNGMNTCLADTIQLNNLNSLSILDMDGLREVEFLLRLSTLGGHCTSLQALRELEIISLPNLAGLVKREDLGALGNLSQDTFSSLRMLLICGCDGIKKLFPVWLLQNLQHLETIDVGECAKLEEIVFEDDDAGSLDPTSSVIFPKLRNFGLHDLPQLRSICEATLFCDSLEIIVLQRCPNLKRLPLHLQTSVNGELSCPRDLKCIWVFDDEDWELAWDNPIAKDVLQPLLRKGPTMCRGPTTRRGFYLDFDYHMK